MSTVSHEQSINIHELSTKTVTIYPQKAEIVREIGGVKLKPGSNEVNIIGITPIADESSIKVEAHGSSIVTDMVVELIKNPEYFDDVYPSDSEDSSDSESEDEPKKGDAQVESLEKKIEILTNDRDAQQEIINSNTSSLQVLERMLGKLEFEDVGKISSTLSTYQQQRSEFYKALSAAKLVKVDLEDKVSDLQKRKIQLENRLRKRKLKESFHKQKTEEKKKRALAQSQQEKKRDLIEKAKFWPRKVYKIKLTIESSTTASALLRNQSFESLATADTILSGEDSEPEVTNLLMTYIVNGVSWTPKYDLSISTVNGSGIMNYRAEVRNITSETWKDAKITLSTSRATFSGVQETIPIIKPWLLHLEKNTGAFGVSPADAVGPTLSIQEKATNNRNHLKFQDDFALNHRGNLFGVPGKDYDVELLDPYIVSKQDYQQRRMELEQENRDRLGSQRKKKSIVVAGGLFGQPASRSTGSSFGQQAPGFGGFGSNSVPPPPSASLFGGGTPTGALLGASAPASNNAAVSFEDESSQSLTTRSRGMKAMRRATHKLEEDDTCDDDEEHDEPGSFKTNPSWEETGLTTNLELHGARTIVPSTSMKRFRIAKVQINQIVLTHVVVPKLRPEAFLRARITNTSPTALLKGSAGLTLDGTFLGHTSLPRCSAGENFLLSLGIDPAIDVEYPTPIARKNIGSGMFNKEQSVIFTRTILLTNTRSGGAAVTLTVKDQIPVSEDERLRIEILTPKGLQQEGDKAHAGAEYVSVRTAPQQQQQQQRGQEAEKKSSKGAAGQSWGQAVAKMDKLGAVEWTVTLKPGKGARLTLEYGIRHPGTDRALEQV